MGVLVGGSAREATGFLQSAGLTHLPIVENAWPFVQALDVEAVPAVFFVQADGTITGRVDGLAPRSLFEKQARKLLAQAGAR